jgi:lactate dehydrogenase-like 2-hydroxyacid dehydrogenase
VGLERLLTESDFILLACGFNDNSKYMFNSNTFKKMKPTSIFINAAHAGQ